ncbi:MAG: hypothetical protein H6662_04160 [Ardenticatenaceae bacterium]|nr:hypothetical protein [Anaerolineales bacterium]MCB8920758.1 hypothetical protein [Ardenticatenaceae bacterium]MCB8989717.1 hypothetical protein [Ardenticatenaceae bacterium]MCB9002824.1 hypothetical protein [Ardenticatenaceae bacterium]
MMTKPWLELNDPEINANDLMAEIDVRVAAHGRFQPHYPTFGHISPMPQPPNEHFAPNLYHHLRALNELEATDSTPELAASPATQLPLLGKLWGMVRAQAHNLVLFYVNRSAADNAQTRAHMVNTLNELTRLVQEQQQEIAALRARLEQEDNA